MTGRIHEGVPDPEGWQVVPSALYEIEVRGVVGATTAAALEGFEVVSTAGGSTRLRGRVVDQSALYGVLNQISGLGLELTGVTPVDD
jgi:hypothetical protein